jgi:hypothetical protein
VPSGTTRVDHTVAPGATTYYRVHIRRSRGFHGHVRLRVRGVPSGMRATVALRVLRVATSSAMRPGSHRLVLVGTSRLRGRVVRRRATVVVTIRGSVRFTIGGDVTAPLFPGANAPLDLVLTNPHSYPIRVTRLDVAIRPDTSKVGCRADANYEVTQFAGTYPLVVTSGRTRLSELASPPALWPRIAMHDLPTNQDACRGAILALDYSGSATR